MTKIMSASLVMFLLCNNQAKSMNKLTLPEKLAIQERRYALASIIANDHSSKRKQKKAKDFSGAEGPRYSSFVYDINGDAKIKCPGRYNSVVATAYGSKNNIDILLEAASYNNVLLNVDGSSSKIAILLNSARYNSVTVNLPLFSYSGPLFPAPELTVVFDGNSKYSSVTIYSWHKIRLVGSCSGKYNSVNIHSPLRKLIWPAITVGFLVWLGSKVFGK
jgi:hypothetical protein